MRLYIALLAVVAAAVAVICAALLVQSALADGDPASDYLISQREFLPLSTSVSTAVAGELDGLLADSKAKGFPLRVAVIASPTDLGSVPSLFGKPQQYARFLGQEDYYFFRDELLVVMPNGYGLYKNDGVSRLDTAAIAHLPAPGTAVGDELVAAAAQAVRALAAQHGLTLTAPRSSSTSRTRDRIQILVGVLVLVALAFGARLVLRRRERG